jgi:flagellar biosynthetic protein FlhB
MADDQEKTEEPTPKKIEDARNEGNVAKSTEVVGALVLLFGSIYLLFFSSELFYSIQNMIFYTWNIIPNGYENADITEISMSIIYIFLYAIAPILILVFTLAVLGNIGQFGFLITPIKLKFDKIDPFKGFGNVFSMKKFVELLKLTLKIFLVIIIMMFLFYYTLEDIIGISMLNFEDAMDRINQLLMVFLGTILLIIIVFALVDFMFVKYHHTKNLKMSIQEIKEEFKNIEGDPHVKARIRQIQHNMSRQRAMAEVPNADVVLTNPTHYAVALKYEKEKSSAPVVVAKGVDIIAHQIKKIALENDVPIIENPALARSLYDQVDVDQAIPENFYKAIAEIFIYIYELKNKGKK